MPKPSRLSKSTKKVRLRTDWGCNCQLRILAESRQGHGGEELVELDLRGFSSAAERAS